MVKRYYSETVSRRTAKLMLGGCCCLLLTLFSGFNLAGSYSHIEESILVAEKLAISSAPTWKKTKGKSKRKYIEFKCDGIQKPFEIINEELTCTDTEKLLREIEYGDSVTVWMMYDDHENMSSETWTSKSNRVRKLQSDDVDYVDQQCRNYEAEFDSRSGVWAGIIGAIVFTLFAFTKDPVIFGHKVNITFIVLLIMCLFCFIRSYYFK